MCKNIGECTRPFGEWAAEAGRQLGEHAVSGRFAAGFSRNGRAANALFLLMCLGVFMVVQALGRTHLSDESPEVNSEKPARAAHPAGILLWREFFLHVHGPNETAVVASVAIALRRHCGVRGTVVFANDFHALLVQGVAAGLSAILSTGHPTNGGLDEGK